MLYEEGEIVSKNKNNENKCSLKCLRCQFYSKTHDYCVEKEIEQCSKKSLSEFSNCESYLINDKLILF